MKDKEELKFGSCGLSALRVGTHKNSIPYINFEHSGMNIGMPNNSELRKLRRMINYVLKDKPRKKK